MCDTSSIHSHAPSTRLRHVRQIVRDLIERTIPLTLTDLPDKGVGWQVYPALFARIGVTPAARKTLMATRGIEVDLPTLFADLAEA
jgi:hypothetical protein